MATVTNKADSGAIVDKTLVAHNRTNAGDPNGALTPMFSGEIVLDTITKVLWQAQSLTNTSWVQTVPGMYL
jgi:hypothetical protein